MKNFKFTINGNQYECEVAGIDDNIADIIVNGTHYKVEVDKTLAPAKTPKLVRQKAVPSTDQHPSNAKTASPDAPKGGGTIKSPLPGVVLELHVKVGDVVKFGQRLLTLEAMKMENNIESDKEGKVVEIKKNKGDSVMEGDVLIIIGD